MRQEYLTARSKPNNVLRAKARLLRKVRAGAIDQVDETTVKRTNAASALFTLRD
jgi:hypothetical protein